MPSGSLCPVGLDSWRCMASFGGSTASATWVSTGTTARSCSGSTSANIPRASHFWGLELGLAALLLALAFAARLAWPPLILLGQTALFYYLLHIHLLKGSALLLGVYKQEGLLATYLATFAVLVVLLPLCRWYRGYKRAHPTGWPQYI